MIPDVTQKTPIRCHREVTPPRPGVVWIVSEDFVVGDMTVPAGFETDLGSIPIGARNVVSPNDAIEAFILHDWLYYTGRYPRKLTDEILRAMMAHLPGWKAWAVYRGLRIGGWVAWNKHRKARPAWDHSC